MRGWWCARTRPWLRTGARKREELLQATERELDKVVEAGRAGRLKSKDAIGLRVGKIVGQVLGWRFGCAVLSSA